MAWTTEFVSTDPQNRRVEYQTNALRYHSRAERPDRVKVSGRVVHTGWVSDHQGYALFQSLVSGESVDLNTRYGYTVGDYVIVSHPDETTAQNYVARADTFRVTGFTENRFGAGLVRVQNIAHPSSGGTVFYPRELSREDGTRPTV